MKRKREKKNGGAAAANNDDDAWVIAKVQASATEFFSFFLLSFVEEFSYYNFHTATFARKFAPFLFFSIFDNNGGGLIVVVWFNKETKNKKKFNDLSKW